MTERPHDSTEYAERLNAKLRPARVRSTLAFAGLFQLTHEMLKSMVLDDVKSFYGYSDIDGAIMWIPEDGHADYKRHVLDLHKDRFIASLLWLQQMDALTADQAERLNDIYKHRHALTHELARYLIDPDLEPDVDLLVQALKTLTSLSQFWTRVEAGLGTFADHPDVDLNDVKGGRMLLIELCISAYTDSLTSTDPTQPDDAAPTTQR